MAHPIVGALNSMICGDRAVVGVSGNGLKFVRYARPAVGDFAAG